MLNSQNQISLFCEFLRRSSFFLNIYAHQSFCFRVKNIRSVYIDTTFCMPSMFHLPTRVSTFIIKDFTATYIYVAMILTKAETMILTRGGGVDLDEMIWHPNFFTKRMTFCL